MATSLSRQLENLRVPQTSIHKEKRGSVSFIYDFLEAKTINIDTHYSIAINSLQNLIRIDVYFQRFMRDIFHESSKKLDRAIKSREENDQLDRVIEDFLFHLSKYFQLNDSHKLLEYLIQKYQINEYNVDALIGSVLPYYETRLFVRLIQTCSAVKNPQNQRFYWMKKFQENGVPISKSIFIKHCIKDFEFSRYVFDTIFKSLEIDPENTIFPSFLASFGLILIQDSSKNDQILSLILSAISKCFNSEQQNLFIVGCMILSHLCNLVRLESKIVQKLLKLFARKQRKINESMLISLEIIIKSQNLESLPDLYAEKDFIDKVVEYSSEHRLENLVRAIVITILIKATKHNEEIPFDVDSYRNFFNSMFEIPKSFSRDSIGRLLRSINENQTFGDNEGSSPVRDLINDLIATIERLHPDWLESILSSFESIKNLSLYLKSIRHIFVQNLDLPLSIGLVHQKKSVRKRSLLFFAKNLSNLYETNLNEKDLLFIRQTLRNVWESVADRETLQEIFIQILGSQNPSLDQIFEPNELVDYFSKIYFWIDETLQNDIGDEKTIHLKRLILETYCKRSCSGDNELNFENLMNDQLLQLLLICFAESNDFTEIILSSDYGKTNPLLKQITSRDNRKILEEISKYFYANLDLFLKNFDDENNFGIKSSENLRFQFLLIYVFNRILCNLSTNLFDDKANSVRKILIDLLWNFSRRKIKIVSNSEIKIVDSSQFKELDIDELFLKEFRYFNGQSISLVLIGHFFDNLIERSDALDEDQKASYNLIAYQSTEHRIDFKIYSFLMHYSTPNEHKPISKSVYRLFRHLFTKFLAKKIQIHNNGFKFFLPLIVKDDEESVQNQTLTLLKELFECSPLSNLLIASLISSKKYLIGYLLALSSSRPSTRQLALTNLKRILKKLSSNEDKALRNWIERIIQQEASILNSEDSIIRIINNSSTIANGAETSDEISQKLYNSILAILNEKESNHSSHHKISLFRLLKYSGTQIKNVIFKQYLKILCDSGSTKIIDRNVELELETVLSYFNDEIFENLYSSAPNQEDQFVFMKFWLKCIEKCGLILSEKIANVVYDIFDLKTFEKIRSKSESMAMDLVYTMLFNQMTLSERQSLVINYSNLINSMQKRMRTVLIDSDFLMKFLNYLMPIQDIYETFTIGTEIKRIKMDACVYQRFTICWKLFRICVSIISNIEQFDCSNELIQCLFEYLKLTFMEVGDNSSQLTRQSILFAIVNCIESKLPQRSAWIRSKCSNEITQTESMEIDSTIDQQEEENLKVFLKLINVDTVIDCMMESRVKETQRVSMFLINLVAPYFQKEIIKYLVTIFTFIGSNLLECDDQYSMSILFETMESIIPIIIVNDKTKTDEMKHYIASVFIKSYNDIPAYRRLPLFLKLIKLLDSDQFLPIVAVYLIENISSSKLSTYQATTFAFIKNLFDEFSLEIQMQSICAMFSLFERRYLGAQFRTVLMQKFNKSFNVCCDHSSNADDLSSIDSLSKLIMNICTQHKPTILLDNDKMDCGLKILKFISSFITDVKLISRIRSDENRPESKFSHSLIYLINIILESIVLINFTGNIRSSLNVYRKQFKTILDEILLRYHSLVSVEKLSAIVLDDLMNNVASNEQAISALIKRKALELLNEKFLNLNPNERKDLCIEKIIITLCKHLETHLNNFDQLNDHQIHNTQLILVSLKTSTKFIENDVLDRDMNLKNSLSHTLTKLISTLDAINQDSHQSEIKFKSLQSFKTSSILCSTQILIVLSLEGIPFLSDNIRLILKNFSTTDETTMVLNIVALNKIIMNFPKFLGSNLNQILLKILSLFDRCTDESENLRSNLNKILSNIGKHIPTRFVFDTINSIYDEAIENYPKSIIQLRDLFRISCKFIEKTDVDIILKNFKNFMLKALEFRYLNHSKFEPSMLNQIENSLCETFALFFPKLTESNFRPIYYSIQEWAFQLRQAKISDPNDEGRFTFSTECYQRMITFFRFCSCLADSIKSLFCIFVAPSIVQNFNEVLIAYHSPDLESFNEYEDKTKEKERRLKIEDPTIGEPLVSSVLMTISKCFLYDLNCNFVNQSSLATIVRPIIDQISNLFGSEKDYQNRLELILQCTQFLIQNNKDESLIKDFNYQLLLKTRESNEKIKMAAVKVLHRLILSCGEDYLPFVPETIPFIAELSEEDSSEIEKELKEMVNDIEQLIGEPIDKYL
ncbi:hypothetical protein NH340_JMT01390 [Sarcoptes scabiei]|nr:hypothetical protein NH340_JMT01390 [Sarcoptes scabiei]